MARRAGGPRAEARRASARRAGARASAGFWYGGCVAREVGIDGRFGERCWLSAGPGPGMSRDEARRVAQRLSLTPAAESALRGLLFSAVGIDAGRLERADLLPVVERLLQRGAIVARTIAPARGAGGAGERRESEREDRDAPLVQTDWIGLELVDADGAPVAFEPYVVELADGRQLRGRLGADGTAVVRGIPSGQCKITFPQRGAEMWSGQ